MKQLFRLYHNKLIPKGRYFVKIVKLTTESKSRRPFIEVVLRISDMHEQCGGTELYCPIHPTSASDAVYERFLDAFDLAEDELAKAVGRYTKVCVKHREYNGTDYAAVRFVRQRDADYADVAQARKADKEKVAQAQEKAAKKAKKQAEKEAWEAVHGPRGRGRPRLGNGAEVAQDLFA